MKQKRTKAPASGSAAALVRPLAEALASEAEAWLAQRENDALHDARVASRRLRALLRLIDDIRPRRRAARLGQALRAVTRVLGRPREADVMLETLEPLQVRGVAAQAALEYLRDLVRRRVRKRHKRLAVEMEQVDCGRLAERLISFAASLGEKPLLKTRQNAWELVEPHVSETFAPTAELRTSEDAEALHEQRIALKKLRYRIELIAQTGMLADDALLKRLKRLQDAIGSHHDVVVLQDFVAKRQRKFEKGGSSILAKGLEPVQAALQTEREQLYRQFVSESEGLSPESFGRELRSALRLADGAEGRV